LKVNQIGINLIIALLLVLSACGSKQAPDNAVSSLQEKADTIESGKDAEQSIIVISPPENSDFEGQNEEASYEGDDSRGLDLTSEESVLVWRVAPALEYGEIKLFYYSDHFIGYS